MHPIDNKVTINIYINRFVTPNIDALSIHRHTISTFANWFVVPLNFGHTVNVIILFGID